MGVNPCIRYKNKSEYRRYETSKNIIFISGLNQKTIIMANTYSKIYLQFVFSVKNRQSFLNTKDEQLAKYLGGIINNLKCTPLSINNMKDHIHIFLIKYPTISEAELAQKLKNNSSRWLKTHLKNNNFGWQNSYGIFSYGHSQIDAVNEYINNQQTHHKKYLHHEYY